MASHSPHPNSLSPHSKQPTSAFQWPIPPSPSHLKPVVANPNMNDITVKEILERYNEDPELLKYILTAKSEEDKKKAAKDTLKAEEARIQLRHMDLELAREQSKASTRLERPVYPPGYPHPYPHAAPPIHHQGQLISHPHPHHPYPYYSLAPVQQQVLARFNSQSQHAQGQQQPPASPSMPYPHSAHPLCPPPAEEKNFPSRLPQFRQTSPSSAAISEENKKRNRSSISSPNDIEQDKLSHNKVMEALKAKIQRSNGGPPSPLTASPIRPPQSQSQDYPSKKKKPTLPRPVIVHEIEIASSPSPSPRSAKPVLPPIDTNLGRIDTVTKTTTTTSRTTTKSDTESINSATSSHSSGHQENVKHDPTESTRQQDTKSSIDINNNNNNDNNNNNNNNSTASPSDHILLNTRRARSLSPPSSANNTPKDIKS